MKNLEELKIEADQIRSQVGEGQRLRWPKPFRMRVLEAVKEFGDCKFVAKNIGLAYQTIMAWKPADKKPSFKEVEVVEEPNISGLTLAWGKSLEVRGLSFEQFASLLREGLL